jgi:2-dehydro-3-deoxyphosphogluconate aldolase/(4S)-4-hydroxy-2-oxoglutarate aldolase
MAALFGFIDGPVTGKASIMNAFTTLMKEKIIVIARNLDPEHALPFSRALLSGGIHMVEVTFDQQRPESWEETARSIRAIRDSLGEAMTVGAGTVLTMEQLGLARVSGASYMVSPNVDVQIIRQARASGMSAFPGALTPTEIVAAFQAGADAVKLFPAANLGPEYLKAVKAPLSHIPIIAVGGIDVKNCAAYMAAGAAGIGIGGSIANKQWMVNGQWDKISALAQEFVKAVH